MYIYKKKKKRQKNTKVDAVTGNCRTQVARSSRVLPYEFASRIIIAIIAGSPFWNYRVGPILSQVLIRTRATLASVRTFLRCKSRVPCVYDGGGCGIGGNRGCNGRCDE